MLLSVDFGTSNTAAAYRDSAGVIREIPLSSTGAVMPSAVLYTTGWIFLVGQDAVRAAPTAPLAFEPSPKRRMAEPEISLGGMFIPVIDMVAAVLAEALATAERAMGERPEQVVLTYPDHWGSPQQERLAAAAEVAGIDKQRQRLVSEASAAAGYLQRNGYRSAGGRTPVGG